MTTRNPSTIRWQQNYALRFLYVILVAGLSAVTYYYSISNSDSAIREFSPVAVAKDITDQNADSAGILSTPANPEPSQQEEIIPPVVTTQPQALSPSLVAEDIRGSAGQRIPVRIKISPPKLARKLTILVKGLPEGVSLSEGRALDDGRWQLETRSTRGLMLTAPQDIAGTYKLQMTLYTSSGKVKPEVVQIVNLVLDRSSDNNADPGSDQAAESARTPLTAGQAIVPALPAAQLNALITRGNQMMSDGDVSAAQLIFEHVEKLIVTHSSDADISQAALDLGKTYDPGLATQQLASIPPNPALARKWYGLAASNGNFEALKRLKILEDRLGVSNETETPKRPRPSGNCGSAGCVM